MREQDGDAEPAHHARRPMNAFLIFCKRHRSVVRDKYPNLENRSITKILGEWWANLDKEEKACYTGLAKQYKDAFFNANPDFKWYKLPAPPLRTLCSRPRDHTDKEEGSPTSEYQEEDVEKINNNSTEVDLNSKDVLDGEQRTLSMFTPGKLADEAQMGGISSLLSTNTESQPFNPYYTPPPYKPPNPTNDTKKPPQDTITELQNELSQTTRMFEHFDDDKRRPAAVSPDDITNQDVIDQIVEKRFSKEEDYDDDRNAKGRSCKGKRYQEFMAVGGLMIKRQKRDLDKSSEDGYNASCSWEPSNSQSEDSFEVKQDSSYKETSLESETEQIDTELNTNKSFKAADFDLDAKIRALPSLSLDKFQQRKRENKRKKKTINLRPKSESIAADRQQERKEMAENWRQTVIGSQKRKPRKISITRLEINSLISSVDIREAHRISPQIKIAHEAPSTVVQNMDICKPQVHNVDLFALATLAEVASNTSKIEEATVLGSSREDHASTV